jgi:hypothetical protein
VVLVVSRCGGETLSGATLGRLEQSRCQGFRRHLHPWIIGPNLLESSGNLLRGTLRDQPVNDLVLKLEALVLANERPLADASLGLAVGADGRLRAIGQSVSH